MRSTRFLLGISVLVLGLGLTNAFGDACSGRSHTGGTIAGGVLGAVFGGMISHGSGVGIVGGALLGSLAGNALARDMDCQDRPYAARAYYRSFHGPVGRRYAWSRGPNHGYVIVNREYWRGHSLCRDLTQVVYRHGREFDREATACRRGDGQWAFL